MQNLLRGSLPDDRQAPLVEKFIFGIAPPHPFVKINFKFINIWDIAPMLRDIVPMLRDDVHKLTKLQGSQ
jgi:hypothetical protein